MAKRDRELRNARERINYTQEAMGKLIGVKCVTIGRWESGAVKAPPHKREELLRRAAETVPLERKLNILVPVKVEEPQVEDTTPRHTVPPFIRDLMRTPDLTSFTLELNDFVGKYETYTYDGTTRTLSYVDHITDEVHTRTYNEQGKQLRHDGPGGYWSEFTYSALGKMLTHETSSGWKTIYERDEEDKRVSKTVLQPGGYGYKHIYDSKERVIEKMSITKKVK